MKEYARKSWKHFRLEVIDLDGGVCSVCGRGEPDVTLQVHHKKYIPGVMPWEYAYKDCVTLCKGCHAAEHGIIPPKHGWEYAGYDDLGDLTGSCDLCGNSLRHQFYVFHPNWGTMEVGEYCCDALTDSEVASNLVESKKRFEDRKKRFIKSSRWAESPNRHTINQNKISVEVVRRNGLFRIVMNGRQGKMDYDSLEEAKVRVFETIESGEARTYLEKQKKP